MEEGDGHPQGRRHDRAVRQLRRLRRRRECVKGPGRKIRPGPFLRYGAAALPLRGLSGVCLRVRVGALGAMSGGGGRGARERRRRARGEGGGGRNGRRGGRAGRRVWGVVIRGGERLQGASGAGKRFRMPGNVGQEGSQVVLATLRGVRPCASGARRRRRASRSREGPTWQTKRRNVRRT